MTTIYSRLRYIMMIFVSILTLSVDIHAFDGKREGFFLGLGIEPGVAIWLNADDLGTSYYAAPSITGPTFKLGYGLSEQFLLYISSRTSLNGAFYYSFDDEEIDSSDIFGDGTLCLGLTYFVNQDRILYITTGLGIASSLNLSQLDYDDILIGTALSGGIGIEISRQLAMEIMADYRIYDELNYSLDIATISLAFNFLFY